MSAPGASAETWARARGRVAPRDVYDRRCPHTLTYATSEPRRCTRDLGHAGLCSILAFGGVWDPIAEVWEATAFSWHAQSAETTAP